MRKPRKDRVTKAQQQRFLEELAATCNVSLSAERAEIKHRTVYRIRERDEAFRHRWDIALDQGYVGLEAALLEQAKLATSVEGPQTERAPAVGAMDAKLAFALLQNHQRFRGKGDGDKLPLRSDLKLAVERLETALKRFPRPAGGKPAKRPARSRKQA